MNVKKFSANSSREAWRLVREAMGPDAVILSNRSVNGVVEIMAIAGEDMSSLTEPMQSAPAALQVSQVSRAPGGQSVPTVPPARQTSVMPTLSPRAQVMAQGSNGDDAIVNALGGRRHEDLIQSARPAVKQAPVPPAVTPQKPSVAAPAANDIPASHMADMMSELRSLRGMLESQLAEISWGAQQKREPIKAALLREMLSAGFSASLARYVSERLPTNETSKTAMTWVRAALARNVNVIGNEQEVLERGGVYALVGPTGVGKTTTTAKLAARCVMRHGAGKLALITTDGYRIGGYEQLRIYGKILGVMVHSVKDETDLRIALAELKNKHTVLIDTVGMGQRDKMVSEQIAMLSGTDSEVKRLLCLSATSNGETLNEVVRSYRGGGLAGCIITKLDEAATIGSVLDVIIRQKLRLYYVASGQRVPEDLHVANQHYLLDRAFKLKRETGPFQFQDQELPLVVGNAVRGMNAQNAREVSHG
jgi:flagellar biosynthesis protein FlhF